MSDENTKPYRPSNGSEGDMFQAHFCEHCVFDKAARSGDYGNGCDILLRALVFKITDANYPQEWRQNIGAEWDPFCTAFKEEDDDEDREPPPPDPDPRQIVLIADPTEDIGLPLSIPEPTEVPANV